jgi:hypothetical protein
MADGRVVVRYQRIFPKRFRLGLSLLRADRRGRHGDLADRPVIASVGWGVKGSGMKGGGSSFFVLFPFFFCWVGLGGGERGELELAD